MVVKRMTRGQSLDQAQTLFTGQADRRLGVGLYAARTPTGW